MYALQWGAGLAAVGWLRGPAAVAAGVKGMVSAVLGAMVALGTHALAFYDTNYLDRGRAASSAATRRTPAVRR